jgi:hypothetical protein
MLQGFFFLAPIRVIGECRTSLHSAVQAGQVEQNGYHRVRFFFVH